MKEVFSAVIKGRQPGFATFTLYADLSFSWSHCQEHTTGNVEIDRKLGKKRLKRTCKQLAIHEARQHTTTPRIQEFSLCYGILKGGTEL